MKKGWGIALALVLALAGGIFVFRGRVAQTDHSVQGAALYFCPMHPKVTSPKPGDCPICHMRLVPADHPEPARAHAAAESSASAIGGGTKERKILFYRNPMNPSVTSPAPAKDEMGMDYLPVYEDEMTALPVTEGRIGVKIQSDKQQLIGMRLGPVEKKHLQKKIRAVGRIAYDPELYQAQTEFLEAVKSSSGLSPAAPASNAAGTWAASLEKSSRTRLKLLGLSEDLIEELAREGKPDQSLLYAHPGGRAWVYATIYEYEIPLVRSGDPLEVTLSSRPDVRLEGKVRSIDTLVDPQTRTVRVRGTIENRDGWLKPDLFVNVSLGSDLGEVIAVPEGAVLLSGTRALVFVEKEPGFFEPRRVTLGAKAEGFYEIRGGLSEGEKVVTSGNFFVDSESRLKAALQGWDETAEVKAS